MLLLAFCRAALNVGSVRWLEEGSESRQQGTQKQEVGAGTKTESLRKVRQPSGELLFDVSLPVVQSIFEEMRNWKIHGFDGVTESGAFPSVSPLVALPVSSYRRR